MSSGGVGFEGCIATVENIVASMALQLVISRTTDERVGAISAGDTIVTDATEEEVAASCADEIIVPSIAV